MLYGCANNCRIIATALCFRECVNNYITPAKALSLGSAQTTVERLQQLHALECANNCKKIATALCFRECVNTIERLQQLHALGCANNCRTIATALSFGVHANTTCTKIMYSAVPAVMLKSVLRFHTCSITTAIHAAPFGIP